LSPFCAHGGLKIFFRPPGSHQTRLWLCCFAICNHLLLKKLNSETNIKNVMAGWTDKKPFGAITLLLEHRVKTIFVSAGWTNLKLVIYLNVFDFVIHTILPVEI
jgi:hypothetical protein